MHAIYSVMQQHNLRGYFKNKILNMNITSEYYKNWKWNFENIDWFQFSKYFSLIFKFLTETLNASGIARSYKSCGFAKKRVTCQIIALDDYYEFNKKKHSYFIKQKWRIILGWFKRFNIILLCAQIFFHWNCFFPFFTLIDVTVSES